MTPAEAIASIRASIAAGLSPRLSDIEVLIAECGREQSDAELYRFLKTHDAMHPTKPNTEYGICELTFDANGKQLSAFWVGAGDVEAAFAAYLARKAALPTPSPEESK